MKRKDFSKLKIDVQKEKNNYFEHEEFIAGTTPFLRGIDSSMYLQTPIKNSTLVNLSSPEKCNAFIREKISAGSKIFTFHFNHNLENSVNTKGIELNSIEDIQQLFKDINLLDLNITISSNCKIKTTLILFLIGIKQINVSINDLAFNILLNEEDSAEIVEDIFSFSSNYLPKQNSIIISSTTPNELTPEIELANLLTTSYSYILNGVSKGDLIDSLATKISFNQKIGNNHFNEIAKMRAARLLWAKMIQQFNAKNQQTLALKTYTTTNNTIQVLTSFLGGAQALTSTKVNSLYIEEETNILKTVDPWAGSNYIEEKTLEIAKKTWTLFEKQKSIINPHKEKKSDSSLEQLLKQISNCKEIKDPNFLNLIAVAFEKNVTLEVVFKAIHI